MPARGCDRLHGCLPGGRNKIPAVEDYAALVFLGGRCRSTMAWGTWRGRWRSFARRGRGQPVLGICLGAQLIAKALGAKVYRNAEKEIGWFDLRFTRAAASDPVFAGLSAETVFHWHGETLDLRQGRSCWRGEERCRHQAFRLDSHIYGLQFHLEVTPGMVADWCVQDENCVDMRELHAPIEPSTNATRLAVLAEMVFGRWWETLSTFRA